MNDDVKTLSVSLSLLFLFSLLLCYSQIHSCFQTLLKLIPTPLSNTMAPSPRNVCITAADGQTGFLIAELLLTSDQFKKSIDSVSVLTLHPSSAKIKELHKLGAVVVPHKPGRQKEVIQTLKDTKCDTICLIPPTHVDKFDITLEMIHAAKESGTVQNVLFISSAGCDLAERDKQPRLREFIDLETEVMKTKGDSNVPLGHSPCILRWV